MKKTNLIQREETSKRKISLMKGSQVIVVVVDKGNRIALGEEEREMVPDLNWYGIVEVDEIVYPKYVFLFSSWEPAGILAQEI